MMKNNNKSKPVPGIILFDVEEIKKSWVFFSVKAKKNQAKHMIEYCRELVLHEINNYLIFKMNGYFEVINCESLHVEFFQIEEEGIDYCLDRYKKVFTNKQADLFENLDKKQL